MPYGSMLVQALSEKVQLAFNSRSHLAELVADVFAVGPGPVDGVVVEAGDDVPVAVIDRLAGGPAVVDDDVEPVGAGGGLIARQSRGRSEPAWAASASGRSPRWAWCALGTSRTCGRD